jgi:hypothetical protein
MGVREWFSQTNATPQQSVSPNISETSSIENLPDAVKADAVEAARPAAKIMDRVGHANDNHMTHSGGGESREALVRNQGDQGKEQSAMSPTDHGKSQTATQARSQSRGRGMER